MGGHGTKKQFSINLSPSQKVTQKVNTVRYLFAIEFIDGNFIYIKSEFSQPMFSL